MHGHHACSASAYPNTTRRDPIQWAGRQTGCMVALVALECNSRIRTHQCYVLTTGDWTGSVVLGCSVQANPDTDTDSSLADLTLTLARSSCSLSFLFFSSPRLDSLRLASIKSHSPLNISLPPPSPFANTKYPRTSTRPDLYLSSTNIDSPQPKIILLPTLPFDSIFSLTPYPASELPTIPPLLSRPPEFYCTFFRIAPS